jgi:DNA-directed RNA polymerase beta subunit
LALAEGGRVHRLGEAEGVALQAHGAALGVVGLPTTKRSTQQMHT